MLAACLLTTISPSLATAGLDWNIIQYGGIEGPRAGEMEYFLAPLRRECRTA